MYQKTLLGLSLLAALAASPANAVSVSPTFTDQGIDTTGTATSTRMYRADLTGLGLSEIGAITVNDSNSGIGGSPGIYSGFDLDAIFLDIDGLLSTAGDRITADSFQFAAGSLRPGGTLPPSPSGGPTNGSSSSTTVDEAFATLGAIDGLFFGSGSLTLGDGGSLTAIFDPKVALGSSLFLFVGEVSGDPGETVTGLVEVSETPPPPMGTIPLPAGIWLMLSGLMGLGGLSWRRAAASAA
ncbi:MAG: hypothetical protein AAF409_08525 [Pseudomonadota bacterium]